MPRLAVLVASAALLCGAVLVPAAEARGDDGGIRLHKPVIVNPLETPTVAASLKGISEILGNEPAAAADPAPEPGSDADGAEEGMDDVALMGEDSCDSLPSEKCKSGGRRGESSSPARPASAGSEESSGLAPAAEESSAAPAAHGKPSEEAEIKNLETLIADAMKISKAIPEKVKRLEQLKHHEEEMTEERARAEAEGTLKEHARLLEEMKSHISKLESKLNELKKKRDELTASDNRLKATLGKAVAVSEESTEESSEESSESSHRRK